MRIVVYPSIKKPSRGCERFKVLTHAQDSSQIRTEDGTNNESTVFEKYSQTFTTLLNPFIMRNPFLTFLLLMFILPFGAICQTETPSQMLVLYENEIPPSMVSEYEEVAKKELAIFKKLNYPRSYYVYQTEDFHYWWVVIIEDITDFEKFIQELGSYIVRMEKEEGFDFRQEFKGKTYFMKPTIIQWLPDLSNMPEGTMDLTKTQYFRWGRCYVKVGEEDKFIQNFEEWIKLFKDNQIETGWNLYTGILGTENPYFIWGEIYDSPLDMETKRAKAFETISEQSDKLWSETLQYLRKIEFNTGWYRPDLSYVIENN